jgi:hypothetical protein
MSKPLTRLEAIKGTRIAQAIGAVCLIGALAVAAVGLPGVWAPPPAEALELPDVSPPGQNGSASDEAKRRVNGTALASRLDMVSNRPRVPVVDVPVMTTDIVELPVVDLPPEVEPGIKYLGNVTLGPRRMALISNDDKQSFVGVGGKVGDLTLDVIETEWIRLTSGSTEKIITLAPRGEQVVTRANGGGMGAQGGMSAQQMRNMQAGAARAGAQTRPTAAQILAQRSGTRVATPAANQATPFAGSPFPDQPRNQRYQQYREKLMSSGEYSTEQEVNEAAIKLTEQEYVEGLIPGANPKGVK